MTVITISNVGYGEVGELSNQRRVFAICLTLVGFVLVALAVRFIVESLLSNWTADFWKIKKNRKMIENLINHIIVCGYGRNGRQAV